MTNPIHPDMMYKAINARHEDIRTAETARHAAKQAQSEQSNRAKQLLNTLVSFITELRTDKAKITQMSEVPQTQLSNEQVG